MRKSLDIDINLEPSDVATLITEQNCKWQAEFLLELAYRGIKAGCVPSFNFLKQLVSIKECVEYDLTKGEKAYVNALLDICNEYLRGEKDD